MESSHQTIIDNFFTFRFGEPEKYLQILLRALHLKSTDRESYKNKPELFSSHFGNDDNAYFIDEGGASNEAVNGCAEIINELPETYDHIFCAAGTGTTAAGLIKGINKHELATRLHVIPVLKGGEFIKNDIASYENDLSKLTLHTEYHFGGYAKTTPELINFLIFNKQYKRYQ